MRPLGDKHNRYYLVPSSFKKRSQRAGGALKRTLKARVAYSAGCVVCAHNSSAVMTRRVKTRCCGLSVQTGTQIIGFVSLVNLSSPREESLDCDEL